MSDYLSSYTEVKTALATSLGMTEDVLHIHAGLLILFLAALIFRRRLRSRLPISLVWYFALGNEIVDVISAGTFVLQLEPFGDILNTVLWPTLLFLLARRHQHEADIDRTS